VRPGIPASRGSSKAASGLSRASRRRDKVFGLGRPRALDRNAKVRIMHWARCLSRRAQKGWACGVVSAKVLAVLEALLWTFHNTRSGLCFPGSRRSPRRPLRPLDRGRSASCPRGSQGPHMGPADQARPRALAGPAGRRVALAGTEDVEQLRLHRSVAGRRSAKSFATDRELLPRPDRSDWKLVYLVHHLAPIVDDRALPCSSRRAIRWSVRRRLACN
jgi:hypothetical protein